MMALNQQLELVLNYAAHTDDLTGVNADKIEGVLRHGLLAWNRYNQVLAQWNGDLFWRSMWHVLTGNPKDNDPEMYSQFDVVKHAIITDCLTQTTNLGKTAAEVRIAFNDFTTGIRKAFTKDQMSNAVNYRIASNVQNVYPMSKVFKPNLHLKMCEPLSSIMTADNATSLQPTNWLIQYAAGMMLMTPEMCKTLLTKVNDPTIRGKISSILNADNNDFTSTVLAVEWLTRVFPDLNTSARESAIPAPCIKSFCESFADLIASNKLYSNAIEESVVNLQGCQSTQHLAFDHAFSVEAAATENVYFPRWLQGDMTSVIASVKDMPITDNIPFAVPICSLKTEDPDCQERDNYADVLQANIPDTVCLQYPSTQVVEACNDNCSRWDVPLNINQPDVPRQNKLYSDHSVWQPASKYRWMQYLGLSGKHNQKSKLGAYKFPLDLTYKSSLSELHHKSLYEPGMQSLALDVANFVRNPANFDKVMKEVLSVWAARFFKPASRFFDNGQGKLLAIEKSHDCRGLSAVPEYCCKNFGVSDIESFVRPGISFLHGPNISSSSAICEGEIVILRPNIEHEMLGIVMGRGGTQELGATFWGQTELSCYDDAQHGIWGMSYKYHERAMVTNERNLIRVFDVAFDGYNGGMDQRIVDWNDADSRQKFRTATYARDQPYDGPSMLVMQFPASDKNVKNWPNPIAFHNGTDAASATPDPMKDSVLPNLGEHMVFSNHHCSHLCSPQTEARYREYMQRLDMQMWGSVDQSGRPAGDCCVANETASHMLAFQGTMKIYSDNVLVESVQGSGHLGQSYVGVASVREGRGLSQPSEMPRLVRQI